MSIISRVVPVGAAGAGMKPYYDEGGIQIWLGDCRTILPTLPTADLVLTDPPYGIAVQTHYRERQRGALALCNDFPPVYGDDEPFDPSHLLDYPRLILFGANHYADRLPPSGSWLVWDKLDGLESKRDFGFNDGADAELAWTNCGGAVRILRHRWAGLMKASERDQRRCHPTQKPVELMARLIAQYTEPGALVLDPYMGSGPVLRAAKNLGRRCIGVEIEARYCAIAVDRLRQGVLPLEVS